MTKQLHIGVLTGRIPYPNGMAAAQRIHLMARAMAEAGADVNVWVDGLDGSDDKRNQDAIGVKDGIPYEYLLGKTQASHRKLMRVVDRFSLAKAVVQKIAQRTTSQSFDGLYFYTPCSKFDFERVFFQNIFEKNKFPVLLDFREAPWSLNPKKTFFEKIPSGHFFCF